MKIKKIQVQNFKALSNEEMNFDGCSAIITAGNRKGKTSILTGLIKRLQSEKPDIIVKKGELKGSNTIELTDGSKIIWNFSEKSERFEYITKEGIRQTTGVIKQIGERYFGQHFDIDKFLNKSPKQQQKELQNILGLDLEEIEERYRVAYDERTEANRELKRVISLSLSEPQEVKKPDVEKVKAQLSKARKKNEEIKEANREFEELTYLAERVRKELRGSVLEDVFDVQKALEIINSKKSKDKFIDISSLEVKLDEANEQLRKFDAYERDLKQYKSWVKEGKKARLNVENAEAKVKEIEKEKEDKIKSAKMPNGFGFDESGLTYNGFPLTENQLSTSEKYIAALQIGELVLGEVRTLHFDASTLDNNYLKEVQKWAESKNLQLLIERPDFDGGDIQYEIINKTA